MRWWTTRSGLTGSYYDPGQPSHDAYAYVIWELPMLIAAVDPAVEAALDGLDRAVTSGHYLAENAGVGAISRGGSGQQTFPVLATTSSGIGETAVTRVQRLAAPSAPPSLTVAMMTRDASVPGQTVLTSTISAQQAYQQMLGETTSRGGLDTINDYWTVGPVSYQRDRDGRLTPAQASNSESAWRIIPVAGNVLVPPMDESGTQYRAVRTHLTTSQTLNLPIARLAGLFDPARIRSFNPLSAGT